MLVQTAHTPTPHARRRPSGDAVARALDLPEGAHAPYRLLRPVPRGPLTLPPAGDLQVVLEGAVLQRVRLGVRAAAHLLGPGDVLVPPPAGADGFAIGAQALSGVVVGQLRLERQRRPEPALVSGLLASVARTQQRMVEQHAIAQLTTLEERVARLLPQLADRWGVVCPDGVLLPAFLSHTVFADLVGVRRPSFTTGAGRLERSGMLRRRHDGRWLLGSDAV